MDFEVKHWFVRFHFQLSPYWSLELQSDWTKVDIFEDEYLFNYESQPLSDALPLILQQRVMCE